MKLRTLGGAALLLLSACAETGPATVAGEQQRMIAHQAEATGDVQRVAGYVEPPPGWAVRDPDWLDRNRRPGASPPGSEGTPQMPLPVPGGDHHAVPTSTILGP